MATFLAECPVCSCTFEYERFNARFGNQGYMYCDSDPTVLTWNAYDPAYSTLSGNTHPWMLDEHQMTDVEEHVIACPSGGHFRFAALPRCPNCNSELEALHTDPAYFVVIQSRLDGDKVQIWTGEIGS
jgi:hypothetical protein